MGIQWLITCTFYKIYVHVPPTWSIKIEKTRDHAVNNVFALAGTNAISFWSCFLSGISVSFYSLCFYGYNDEYWDISNEYIDIFLNIRVYRYLYNEPPEFWVQSRWYMNIQCFIENLYWQWIVDTPLSIKNIMRASMILKA